MASGTIRLTSNRSNLEGRITWSSSSNGTAANSSNITGSLQVKRNDGYSTTGTWKGEMEVAGVVESFSVSMTIGSEWVTIKTIDSSNYAHKDDGSQTAWISGWCEAPSGTALAGAVVNGSETVTLDRIPRYLTITSFYVQSTGLNTAKIYWAVSNPRDSTQYSLNGASYVGSSTYGESVASDGKSGTFNINKLSPETTYKLKVKIKRTDSQLTTESSEINFTTKSKAIITNYASGFSINNESTLTVKANNPSGNQIAYYIDCPAGTRRFTSTRTTAKSYTWTKEQITSLLQYFKSSNSNTIRVGVNTYGDNIIYFSYIEGKLNVINSNPIFDNFTYQDTDNKIVALTGNNQTIVKGYSNVKGIISSANKATAKNYASMNKYKFVIGSSQKEVNYSSSSEVNVTIDDATSNIFNMYAIDSRGNSTVKQISPSKYLNYTKVVIKNAEVFRTEGVGTETTLKVIGTFWNNSFGSKKNTIKKAYYQYKKTSDSSYSEAINVTLTASGNNLTYSAIIKGDSGANGFSVENSFNVKITIEDELSTATFVTTLGSGTPQIAIAKSGVAFMNMYNPSLGGKLQVNDRVLDKSITYIGTCIDANSCIKPGTYNVEASANNLPANVNGYGVLLVLTNNGEDWKPADFKSWIWQFYMNTENKLYFRCGVNTSTFNSWKIVTLS